MIALQVVALILVGLGGLAVVTARRPERQVIMVSIYGLAMAVLWFVFQAPDVALSQLTIGAVALPLLILLALAKVRNLSK